MGPGPYPSLRPVLTFLHNILESIDPFPIPCPCTGPVLVKCE